LRRSATPSSRRPCRSPVRRNTYSYASLGELVAWIIGWDLILEFALGAATVASGWSEYVRIVCEDTLSIALPAWIDGAHHNLVAALLVLAFPEVVVRLSA